MHLNLTSYTKWQFIQLSQLKIDNVHRSTDIKNIEIFNYVKQTLRVFESDAFFDGSDLAWRDRTRWT